MDRHRSCPPLLWWPRRTSAVLVGIDPTPCRPPTGMTEGSRGPLAVCRRGPSASTWSDPSQESRVLRQQSHPSTHTDAQSTTHANRGRTMSKAQSMDDKKQGMRRKRRKTLDDGRGNPRRKNPSIVHMSGKHGTCNILHKSNGNVFNMMCRKEYRGHGGPIQEGVPRNNAIRSRFLHPAGGKTCRL